MNLGANISNEISELRFISDYNQFSKQVIQKIHQISSPTSVLIQEGVVYLIRGSVYFFTRKDWL